MVQLAPKFKDIQDVYFDFIQCSPLVVGYNVNFDLKFLSAEADTNLSYTWKYADVLPLAKKALPMLANHKLGTVSQYIGFDTNFHDALSDCRACGEVLNYLCRESLIEMHDGIFIPKSSITQCQSNAQSGYVPSVSKTFLDLSDEDFDAAHKYLNQGDDERITGNIDAALRFYDKVRDIGYITPALFDSYAKAYRKLKDYEKEIAILDEAIGLFSGTAADNFVSRKKRAEGLMAAQQKKEELNAQKALEKEQKEELRRRKKEMEASKPKRATKRAVMQCTDDGTVIKEFESIIEAAQECGVNSKCIRDAARGRQKHAGGYCWKFVSL